MACPIISPTSRVKFLPPSSIFSQFQGAGDLGLAGTCNRRVSDGALANENLCTAVLSHTCPAHLGTLRRVGHSAAFAHAALYRHLRRWCSIWAASVMRVENSDGKRVRSSAGGPHGCYPLYFYVVTIWGLRCFAPAIRDSGLTRNRWCFRHQRCITGPAPVWRCAAGFLDKRNGSLVDNISFSVSPSISHPGH